MSGRLKPRFSHSPASMSRMEWPGRTEASEAVPSGRYTQQYFMGLPGSSASLPPRLFCWP